jgi:hypothetical protein
MRVMAAVLLMTVAFLCAVAFGEDVDEQRGNEAPVPYNRHQDPHHGHNHVYPDRAGLYFAICRAEPSPSITPVFHIASPTASGSSRAALHSSSSRRPSD